MREVTRQKEKGTCFLIFQNIQLMNDDEDEIIKENNYSTYVDVAQHSTFNTTKVPCQFDVTGSQSHTSHDLKHWLED
jgi:hypothetical protein